MALQIWLAFNIIVLAIGWFKFWDLFFCWVCALRKPAYEQFGSEPKPRKLGEVYALGCGGVSICADKYGARRFENALRRAFMEKIGK